MDNHKFCFIMCVDDAFRAEEAIYYIRRLHVPENYSVDILSVTDAACMTSGYNEGMQASDARYKIYIHQDVLILEKDMLYKLLGLFQNPDIGMVGVVGEANPPVNGMVWFGGNIGKLYFQNMGSTILQEYAPAGNPYSTVATIDGMFMATQYDIPWREDIFGGWDFYDASQSMEFHRRCLQVIVPHQETPWCLHDGGVMNLKDYYSQRKIFVEEYQKELNSAIRW
ncbi:MAG: glycosyltransferase family protein [Lachnospiraceae bacterium]|nr:glycosyltransferase family protein [Lachnospiraceae bacterium]